MPPLSEAHRAKIAVSRKGQRHSNETKAKISDACIGRNLRAEGEARRRARKIPLSGWRKEVEDLENKARAAADKGDLSDLYEAAKLLERAAKLKAHHAPLSRKELDANRGKLKPVSRKAAVSGYCALIADLHLKAGKKLLEACEIAAAVQSQVLGQEVAWKTVRDLRVKLNVGPGGGAPNQALIAYQSLILGGVRKSEKEASPPPPDLRAEKLAELLLTGQLLPTDKVAPIPLGRAPKITTKTRRLELPDSDIASA